MPKKRPVMDKRKEELNPKPVKIARRNPTKKKPVKRKPKKATA